MNPIGTPFALPTHRGHFELESGLHADTWIALNRLFVEPRLLAPHVDALVALLRPFDPTAICGPLVGGAFVAQAVAIAMGRRFYFTERVGIGIPGATTGLFAARYRLPDDLHQAASAERFAIVDDVVSAGSSVRATADALLAVGAVVEAIGALMVLGDRAVEYFAARRIPLVSASFEPFVTWLPADCPRCEEGIPLSRPGP